MLLHGNHEQSVQLSLFEPTPPSTTVRPPESQPQTPDHTQIETVAHGVAITLHDYHSNLLTLLDKRTATGKNNRTLAILSNPYTSQYFALKQGLASRGKSVNQGLSSAQAAKRYLDPINKPAMEKILMPQALLDAEVIDEHSAEHLVYEWKRDFYAPGQSKEMAKLKKCSAKWLAANPKPD